MSKRLIVQTEYQFKFQKRRILSFSSSECGLATGLGSIYQDGENIWIGWPGLEVSEEDQHTF